MPDSPAPMITTSKCSVAIVFSSTGTAARPTPLIAHENRIAARPAFLAVASCNHIGNAILPPLLARQVLNDDAARPERLRSPRKEAREDAVLKAFDIDLQRVHVVDAGVMENRLKCQGAHADGPIRRIAAHDAACSKVFTGALDQELAVGGPGSGSDHPYLRKVGDHAIEREAGLRNR